MTYYHLSGAINGALFVLALGGLISQLIAIRTRRGEHSEAAGHATAVLSLNYFSVSFLAYIAFFVYGFSISPFNYYLVWPRLLGCLLVLAVLVEIARDRRESPSTAVAAVASTSRRPPGMRRSRVPRDRAALAGGPHRWQSLR